MTTPAPDDETLADSPARRRTRRAIVDAAVHLWARDFSASLGAVADEAGVSRSTLHRYFADRPALVDACLRTALEVLAGVEGCGPTGGSTLDDLLAQLEEMVTLGDWVLFVWADPGRFADHPLGAELFAGGGDDPTLALVRKAQAEGGLDPTAPADWLVSVYYALLYTAAESAVRGALPAREAGRLAVRALRRGVATSVRAP